MTDDPIALLDRRIASLRSYSTMLSELDVDTNAEVNRNSEEINHLDLVLRPAIQSLRASVTGEGHPELERWLCGDQVNCGFIRDICFTVWKLCHEPTHADGNTDWGTDTLPTVNAGVERIRERLAALRAGERGSSSSGLSADTWLPIETAPLDKRVLLWWRPVNDNRHAETSVIGTVSSYEPGKWWTERGDYQDLWHVTHWMPLPNTRPNGDAPTPESSRDHDYGPEEIHEAYLKELDGFEPSPQGAIAFTVEWLRDHEPQDTQGERG